MDMFARAVLAVLLLGALLDPGQMVMAFLAFLSL
jgi:hypothetical protein